MYSKHITDWQGEGSPQYLISRIDLKFIS